MKENLCNRNLHEELGEFLACYILERRSWVTDSGDESIIRSVKKVVYFHRKYVIRRLEMQQEGMHVC
jgi:hypothetical protein